MESQPQNPEFSKSPGKMLQLFPRYACTAIHWGEMSGFQSEPSSTQKLSMCNSEGCGEPVQVHRLITAFTVY